MQERRPPTGWQLGRRCGASGLTAMGGPPNTVRVAEREQLQCRGPRPQVHCSLAYRPRPCH